MQKAKLLLVVSLIFAFSSCLGVGKKMVFQEESITALPYDNAFDSALKAAEEMHEECKKINPFNYPIIVSLGTSKSRKVITIHYKYDPEAGSINTKPPIDLSSTLKRTFVPHFGAEYYMHIRIQKEGDIVKGLKIEITQMKGVKNQVFEEEMKRLRAVYTEFLKKHWQ
ncbi:MAG: hypothetical protein ACUVRL_09200 [Candidatus Saccharicenans sp.]|uniref:hypothetical protein n=1 Tax=Candidatus Saccharicenans sp. TaxID=2819258 RepID=UPI00404A2BDE